jgi:aminoglycoside phosphotransferase (APT) family kinase protein
LRQREPAGPRFEVVTREPNTYESTHRSEIVTCRSVDGRQVRIYAKRQRGRVDLSTGRGGVPYEARVYAEVLTALGVDQPVWHGTHRDARGRSWLFVEELEGSDFLYRAPEPMLLEAAAWIGRFHAASTRLLAAGGAGFLTRYGVDYYAGWATRACRVRAGVAARPPWLERVCERYGACAERLAAAVPTIIHGEFYPGNILVREAQVHPIDWESAAVGAGEIDVAMLTEGWGDDLERQCRERYRSARWPGGPPPGGFPELFDDAALYVRLRWLGDPSQTADEDVFEQLRAAAERLGFLDDADRRDAPWP